MDTSCGSRGLNGRSLRRPYRQPGQGLLLGGLVFACLVFLASCGGGGSGTAVSSTDPAPLPPPPNPESGPEAIGVFPGFSGDLGWVVTGLEGDGGTGGGVGAGADGGGGVGAGGSLGQFRNAVVSATLEDGTPLGSATTDPVTGMVTIRPGRAYAGALLVELIGQGGSEYFDESKNAWVVYPAGQVLRAHVGAIRGNIGLTPLSEAAVALAQTDLQLAQLPLAQRAGESNTRIGNIVNSLLPGSYAIEDVTALPVLLNPSSGKGALPDNPAGRYGTVIGALTVAAGQYNPPLPAPGLSVATQLVLDLSDGKFNGARADGAALAPADQLAYDAMELPGQLVAAIDVVNSRWGVDAADPPLPQTVEFGRYQNFGGENQATARLLSDGTVLVSLNGTPEVPLAANPALPSSGLPATALFSDGAGMMVRRTDGSVQAVGTNAYSGVENAFRFGVQAPTETESLVPVAPRLSQANGATAVAFGSAHGLARTADGTALAWGSNSALQLGAAGIGTQAAPRTVIGSGVRSVAASQTFSLAQTTDGRVMSWGSDRPGALGRGQNAIIQQPPGAVQRTGGGDLTGIVSIAALGSTAIALNADGSVWGWGDAGSGLLGDEAQGSRYVAAPVNGLAAIRKVVPGLGAMVALDQAGVVYFWGLNASQGRALPAPLTGLPRIRDIQDRGAGVTVALGFGDEVFNIGFGGVVSK